jgi:hypothetical protein
MGRQRRWIRRNRHRQRIPADGVEDELDRQSVSDLARPRFKVHGPVVDQVIDAGGPAFEIQICRMAETPALKCVNRPSQHSGSEDRLPKKHTKKRNHNNPKDKGPRVATEGLVVVGGQPVGIAHAKLLGRPPASQPNQRLIKIS